MRRSTVQVSRFLAWALLCAALAVAVTWRVVTQSMIFGHLARPARPDDVGYMLDGLRRLIVLREQGLLAYVSMWFGDPSHSPWQSTMATASFAVLGVRDWAPYAVTGVVVLFAGLLGLDRLVFRGIRRPARAGLLVLAAAAPLWASTVYTFRPDAVMSLWLAAGAALVVFGPLAESSWRGLLVAGLCFAAALWTKPSTFAQTAIVLCGALVLSAAVDLFVRRPRPRVWSSLLKSGFVVAVTVIAVLPHAVVNGAGLWGYFWDNTFGANTSVWVSDLGFWGHAAYHLLSPQGGALHLGWHGLLMLAGVAAGLWVCRRDRESLARAAAFAVLAAGVYLLAAMNGVKQQFFGMPFQFMFVLGGLMGFAALVRRVSEDEAARPGSDAVLVWTAAVAALALWTAPFPRGESDGVDSVYRRAFFAQVMETVESEEAESVFIGAPIPALTADLVEYESLKVGRPIRAFDSIYQPDYTGLSPALEACDLVVALRTAPSWRFKHHFPSVDAQPDLLRLLRSRPDLEPVRKIEFGDGTGGAEIFGPGEAFAGFELIRGLTAPNPAGYRGVYSSDGAGSVVLESEPIGRCRLFAVVRSAPEFGSLEIESEGEAVGRFDLPTWPRWAIVDLEIPGGTVEMRFRPFNDADEATAPRSVGQFRSVVVQPLGDAGD